VLDPFPKRVPRCRKLLSEPHEVTLDELGYGADARGASSLVFLGHPEKRTVGVSCSPQWLQWPHASFAGLSVHKNNRKTAD
jgi:hypothetical protein